MELFAGGDPTRNVPCDADAFAFAGSYLQALGSRLERIDAAILRAELRRDQYCELTQQPVQTWYTAQTVPEITTLYLTVSDEGGTPPTALAADPAMQESLESVGLGSLRLQQMLESSRRIGRVSRLRVVPPPGTASIYRPLALFGLRVAFRCSTLHCLPLPVAVDLVDGTAGKALACSLLRRPLDEERVAAAARRKRQLSFRQAFDVACECAKEHLYHDPRVWEWYRQADRRYEDERRQAVEYFAALWSESRSAERRAAVEQDRRQTLEELRRRFQPRIEVRAELGLLLYVPEHLLPHIGFASTPSPFRSSR